LIRKIKKIKRIKKDMKTILIKRSLYNLKKMRMNGFV